METILKFLKEQYKSKFYESNQINVDDQDLNKINQLFGDSNSKYFEKKHITLKPPITQNQIWSVKNEYDDFLGHNQKANHPFIVIIKTELNEIEGEDFVRIHVISPFIEFASTDDIICNDASVIGFPFLIETWNDQPILTKILDEYLGYYELNSNDLLSGSFKSTTSSKKEIFEMVNDPDEGYSVSTKSLKLNQYQLEFRDIEVSRAKYLNNSVTALLAFLENS